MQGLLLVDKPAGWTSFDVVNYVRKIARQAALVESYKVYKVESEKAGIALDFTNFQLSTRLPKVKVGHTGTLDPFATGLLVLLIGKEFTKRASELSKLDKVYEVTMKLGQTSTTGDPEGEITDFVSSHPERSEGSFAIAQDDEPSELELELAFAKFRGEITQTPPAYSAIKIDGQRAYDLARAGKEVIIQPRKVTINRLEITEYNYPEIMYVADVSSGTYIRTLSEDIAKNLGTGAYTTKLRRTSVSTYLVQDAVNVEGLGAEVVAKNLHSSL